MRCVGRRVIGCCWSISLRMERVVFRIKKFFYRKDGRVCVEIEMRQIGKFLSALLH
jgi:hypothetical protein